MADHDQSYVATRRGVLVKRDLALDRTQNSQFGFMSTGLDDPELRGVDRTIDTKYEMTIQEIETSRRRDPLIFRAVDYYDKLPLGDGLTLSSDHDDILRAARAFWNAHDCDSLQHMMAVELATTANLFIWIPTPENMSDATTMPDLILVPSSQIAHICTKDGAPWYYRRRWTEYEYKEPTTEIMNGRAGVNSVPHIRQQDILAEEMIHVAINRGAGELRGTSMLESAVYWAALYGRTLETIWALAVCRSFLAWHVTIDEADDEQLRKLISGFEKSLVTRRDPRGRMYKTLATGQIMASGPNTKIESLGSGMQANSLDSELRRLLLMVAVASGLPEFALSDGANANLASTLSQSGPLFRIMSAQQKVLISTWKRVYRRVFDLLKQGHGSFRNLPPPEDGDHIVDYLTISGPDISGRDVKPAEAVAAVQAEVWSRAEANRHLRSDWDTVQGEITKEREAGFGPVAPPNSGPGNLPGFSFPPELLYGPGGNGKEPAIAAADNAVRETIAMAIDPTRHKEVIVLMTDARDSYNDAMQEYVAALKANLGNRHEQIRALGAFREKTQVVSDELLAKTRALGVAHAAEELDA